MARNLLTVYLRSGQSAIFECDDWSFKKNNDTSFSSYSFAGLNKGEFVSFDIKEIVGYFAKPITKEENYNAQTN